MLAETRFVTMALAVALLLPGCGGGQTSSAPSYDTPLDMYGWCHGLANTYCSTMARTCFGGLEGVAEGCMESMVSSCVAGREPSSPSGRTVGELSGCISRVEILSCEELGAIMADFEFVAMCQARPESSTATDDQGAAASDSHAAASESQAAATSPARPVPDKLLGHWVAAPPPSQRRAFLITRYALADPPREAELAQMSPTPQEQQQFNDVVRLKREEPGSPLLAELRQHVANLRAIRLSFTADKLITQTPSGVTVTPYRVEEDLGDSIVILEDGSGPIESRRAMITFLDRDTIFLVTGATRVEMERVPAWEDLTPTDVPPAGRSTPTPPAASSTPAPPASGSAASGLQVPAKTGDREFDQCVAEYFECIQALPPEAQSAIQDSIVQVRALIEQASRTPEGRRSFIPTCRSTVELFRSSGYCR